MVKKYSNKLAIKSYELRDQSGIWLLVGMAFLVQPFLVLTVFVIYTSLKSLNNSRGLWGVLFLGSLYLALINVTKIPESDMANYLLSFLDAQQVDLSSYLQLYPREPFYYFLLFGLANFPGIDGRVYVFLSTLAPYLIYGTAVLRLGKFLKVENKAMLSLLIFILFLPQLFSISAHLHRQFLASSLVMLFLAEQAITGKRRWAIGLFGMMIHYSSLFVPLLSFLKPLKRYGGIISVVLHALILLIFYSIALKIAPHLIEMPVLGIVFQRLVDAEGAELDPLTLLPLLTAAFLLLGSFFILAEQQKHHFNVQAWPLMVCTSIICVIVLVSSLQSTLTEIAVRYFFYLYFLIGLVLVFFMYRAPISRYAVYILSFLFVPFFFYKVSFGEWTFAPLSMLLFEPAWELWSYQRSSYM
jgi:hypothetical protein